MTIRPIDAEATYQSMVKTIVNMMRTKRWMRGDKDNEDEILLVIQNAPTLDYEPVVHAEWKYYHKQNRAVCTACSFERDLDDDFGRAVFCPNCGAKMDGGKGNA